MTPWQKWFSHREDLTGEHAAGDAGQGLFALLFFTVWIGDSFSLHCTTALNEYVPLWVRNSAGIPLLLLSAYLAWAGLRTVFGQVRDTPRVIRTGVFGVVRHPVYLSEVVLYAGLFVCSMSLAALGVALAASVFLYAMCRHEERLLLQRFGDEYRQYMREVGMWAPRIKTGRSLPGRPTI